MTHEVRLLGTGNAFLPKQRLHSFMILDGIHIVDAPPTALASLRIAGISPADIETIFITHLHGDHVFCLLYTSDAADEEDSVDLGGRRIIK